MNEEQTNQQTLCENLKQFLRRVQHWTEEYTQFSYGFYSVRDLLLYVYNQTVAWA